MQEIDVPVTLFLRRWCEGDVDALQVVQQTLDKALRSLAHNQLRKGRPNFELGTLELVNEVFVEFLELARAGKISFENRQHFLATFALAVQNTYIDRVRMQAAQKRGGPDIIEHIGYGEVLDDLSGRYWALNIALDRLREHHLRPYLVFMYSEVMGYTVEETGEFLGVSRQIATKLKKLARLFLAGEVHRIEPPSPNSLVPAPTGEL